MDNSLEENGDILSTARSLRRYRPVHVIAGLSAIMALCLGSCTLRPPLKSGDILIFGARDDGIAGGELSSYAGQVVLPDKSLGPYSVQARVLWILEDEARISPAGGGFSALDRPWICEGIVYFIIRNNPKDDSHYQRREFRIKLDGRSKRVSIGASVQKWTGRGLYVVKVDRNCNAVSLQAIDNLDKLALPGKTLEEIKGHLDEPINM